ncbi:hypothetical protein F4780DRAFT_488879 [Xylariomycetidae sp. FL0641]|nr:hypothetical protein F4780DRAFT_488879 [Xylariomycetidae sp. FL0641]
MADPLTIATSVAGLLSLSGSMCSHLSTFVQKVVDAPESTHSLLLAVSEMHMVMSSVSDLIQGLTDCPPGRRAMIQLDHLTLALTRTVITASKIDQFLDRWKISYDPTEFRRLNRIRLALAQGKANGLTTRLNNNLTSISLVLNILNCESDIEAREFRMRLDDIFNPTPPPVSDVDVRLSRSMSESTLAAPFNQVSLISTSLVPAVDRQELATTPPSPPLQQQQRSQSYSSGMSTMRTASFSIHGTHPSRPRTSFEVALSRSRVYERLQGNASGLSVNTENRNGQSWSVLSDISLNDITMSELSVYALPITLQDIQNSQWE